MSCREVETNERGECIRTRDEGYNSCRRREDRGYSRCCQWIPCKWFCDAMVWISNIVCVAWVWVSDIVCVAWASVKKIVCDIVTAIIEIAVTVGRFILSLFGPIPQTSIIESADTGRNVSGVYIPFAEAWSPASGLDYSFAENWQAGDPDNSGEADERFNFRDSGKYLCYTLIEGKVWWNQGNGYIPDLLYEPSAKTLRQLGFTLNEPADLSVSYEDTRQGVWRTPPPFEMIAANGDRVFAKEKGKDNFYLSMPTHQYFHFTNTGRPVILPQTFFINDPEVGRADARLNDLRNPLLIPNDDGIHPATSRFPLYLGLFSLMEDSQVKMNPVVREQFTQMDVRAFPRIWIHMETRPARGSGPVPADYPSYTHVTYKDPSTGQTRQKASVQFDQVLGIGVGLSHFHEQYEAIYGGEIDTLDESIGAPLNTIPGINYNKLYQLANGPIEDIGGWVDGTCIYYMLAQLPLLNTEDQVNLTEQLLYRDPESIENQYFKRRYAVLWIDEQQGFNERWRVLGLKETNYASLVQPVSAKAMTAANRPVFNFSADAYMDPCEQGYIRTFSCMAVSRQVIVLNGFDSRLQGTRRHRLYSIHFSWPTMDRTWRHRELPPSCIPLLATEAILDSEETWPSGKTTEDTVFPQTVRIREDMTIHLRGTKIINGKIVKGRWVQKYLPADMMEIPGYNLRGNAPDSVERGYTHHWQFYEESVFLQMNRTFSHFGVYEKVNSRCQFYSIRIMDNSGCTQDEIETFTWMDKSHLLKIPHSKISWVKAGRTVENIKTILVVLLAMFVLSGIAGFFSFLFAILATVIGLLGLTFGYFFDHLSHSSYFESVLGFKIKKSIALNEIMFFADKREDKTICFKGVASAGDPKSSGTVRLVLTAKENKSKQLDIEVRKHHRSVRKISTKEYITTPEVKSATVTLVLNNEKMPLDLVISFSSARSPQDKFYDEEKFEAFIKANIEKVKLGRITATGSELLLTLDRERDFTRISGSGSYQCRVPLNNSFPSYSELRELINEQGLMLKGISLWFVSVSGQVNISEKTELLQRL